MIISTITLIQAACCLSSCMSASDTPSEKALPLFMAGDAGDEAGENSAYEGIWFMTTDLR